MSRRKKTEQAAAQPAPADRNQTVSFRPPAEMRRWLEARAAKERRPLAQIVEFLVEAAMAAESEGQGQGEQKPGG